MKDGIIELDSEFGEKIGFTSDKYGGYLWKNGNVIVISLTMSKKKGNFRELIELIKGYGYIIDIPNPLGYMQKIVRKHGYKKRVEYSAEMGRLVEIWRL